MLPSSSHLLFIGDSVTDCGRARPVGAGAPPALGYGYVQLVDTELTTRHPGRTGRVTNLGVGGDTIRHLAARWETDVIAQKPDWLSVMIGINDVWHWRKNKEGVLAGGTTKEDFESGLKDIISKIKKADARVILCTASVIGEKNDGSNPNDPMLEE